MLRFSLWFLLPAMIMAATPVDTNADYIAASWVSDRDQRLYILHSEDARTFTGDYAVYDPPGDDVVRDPSLMFDQATGYWWVAYTTAHWSVQSDYIGLARSRDTVTWEHVTQIDTSSVANGDPRSWAPEWIQDDDDWHLIVGLSSDGSATLQMYEMHPTNDDYTTWSQPEHLTGLQSHVVDGMVMLIDGVYNLWYTDRSNIPTNNVRATSTNLTGPYTLDEDHQGNWYGIEASVEGPYVVQIEGEHWRMFFDQPGPGTKLIPGEWTGLYIDSYDNMQTWGPASQMVSPAKRHLSIINKDITPTYLIGDLNDDGYVGLDDLELVLGNWNQNVPPGDSSADPSGDGFVGLDDLDIVLGNWNVGTLPGVLVPEPSGAGLLVLSMCIALRRWRILR